MTEEVSVWLQRAATGDGAALERVATWAYAELERLARQRMRRQFRGRLDGLTLEPAALVNETFVRMLQSPVGFENRRHFLAFASQIMLSALIDYDRRRRASKRGGDRVRVSLSRLPIQGDQEGAAIADFATALNELSALDARKADVVRLRVLFGATSAEAARSLEVSVPTVERDWRFARAWLADRLDVG